MNARNFIVDPWRRSSGFLVGLSLLFTGCSAANPASGDPDGETTSNGRATCEDWQEAYCGWMDECGPIRRAECQARVSTVRCKDSAPVARCVEELSAGCEAPSGCDAEDVADTNRARAQCLKFQQEYCAQLLSCQPTVYPSLGDCVSSFDYLLPCKDAYAVSERYDECVAALEGRACGDQYLPSSCENVIFSQ